MQDVQVTRFGGVVKRLWDPFLSKGSAALCFAGHSLMMVVLPACGPKVEPPIAGNMPDFDVERVAPLWGSGFRIQIKSFKCVQMMNVKGTGSAGPWKGFVLSGILGPEAEARFQHHPTMALCHHCLRRLRGLHIQVVPLEYF